MKKPYTKFIHEGDYVAEVDVELIYTDEGWSPYLSLEDAYKLDDVREALSDIGASGITVIEVKGFGRQKGHTELYRGAEYVVDFLPKIRIEVAVASDQVDQVIEAISGAAKTGKIGDGKIFVSSLEQVVRIRTGETDVEAL